MVNIEKSIIKGVDNKEKPILKGFSYNISSDSIVEIGVYNVQERDHSEIKTA